MKHLHEIKGRWAVRVAVPAPLQSIVGRSELREWLGTDQAVAKRSAPGVIAGFYGRIDEAKARLAGAAPTLRTAAQHHYAEELKADDRARAVDSRLLADFNALHRSR